MYLHLNSSIVVDTGYRSSVVRLIGRAVLVGRITLDNLVIVHDMFIKLAPRRQRELISCYLCVMTV